MSLFQRAWQILRRMSVPMLAAMLGLMVIGVMFIYSAGYTADNRMHIGGILYERQIVWAVAGWCSFLAFSFFDYRHFSRLATWLYAVALVLLILVLVVGASEHGSRRWLVLIPGALKLQPAEVAKFSVMIALARFMSQPGIQLNRFGVVLIVLAMGGAPFFLVALQPDLGTAMVFVPLVFVMMFVGGVPGRTLAILCLIGLMMLPVGWLGMDDYQKERIHVFLNSDRDPLGAGWNKIQSEIAVGSGGFWGKGYMKGTQNILGFLPRIVAPTDFIYSVIAEESGFVGSMAVLILFGIIVVSGLRTALLTRDKLGRLLATGVVTILFAHVFVNIAMTVGLMPITGLPLPLLSYGGSFMISTMAGLGILQSVHTRRPRHD